MERLEQKSKVLKHPKVQEFIVNMGIKPEDFYLVV